MYLDSSMKAIISEGIRASAMTAFVRTFISSHSNVVDNYAFHGRTKKKWLET